VLKIILLKSILHSYCFRLTDGQLRLIKVNWLIFNDVSSTFVDEIIEMRSQKKISFIAAMMISSQILLSLFLAYWVYSQFIEKKDILSNEIERGLRNAEEQVIDSMLASDIINPILGDTSDISVYLSDSNHTAYMHGPMRMQTGIDTISKMVMQISTDSIQEKSGMIRSELIFDEIDSSFENNVQSTLTIHAIPDTGNEILFQGVKMLINTVGRFDVDQKNIYAFFSPGLDTSLLIRTFDNFIESNFNSFTTHWLSIDSINKNDFTYKSHLFRDPYGVSIDNHKFYLTKSIGSQIIFALVLLLITAIAFRMAFVNMRNQMKLITIKNDFISNITHELKTPISTVKVALEALLDFNLREDPKRTKEYLEMAHIEMERLDLLVNQVLNNSAMEEGKSFVVRENFDLVSLVQDVLVSMQSRFDETKALISFIHEKDSVIIKADKLHMHGVLVNLLDNSLKYNNKTPEIKIELIQKNSTTSLSVYDNGIGIPEEYMGSVFDKFFRVPKGEEHSVKGYGLGLNYAALVIKQHGGKITLINNEDSGCCFTLILPDE